jgi:CheY-like chemotaxis protein
VVEDNEDAAESMRLLLEMLGHEVAVERTGDGAVQKARSFHPEIVFCDIGLGGELSGYDVAHALRADPALASAHLVAVTGYGSDSDRLRASAAGFEMHLTKPVHPENLERVVSKLAAAG